MPVNRRRAVQERLARRRRVVRRDQAAVESQAQFWFHRSATLKQAIARVERSVSARLVPATVARVRALAEAAPGRIVSVGFA